MAPTTAHLVYDAARQLLTGIIGAEPAFHLIAYSGGSRGHSSVSTKKATEYLHNQSSTLTSRLATTKTKTNQGHCVQRGGTIPPGHYTCEYVEHHPSFAECIQLHRTADATAIHSPFSPRPIPHGRGDDFFIHGAGPKGSDGCLVPANHTERVRLNKAVKNFSGVVVLSVKNVSYQLPAELEGQLA
jgi:hypothetical protein